MENKMENKIIVLEKEYKSLKSAFRQWSRQHSNFMTPNILKLFEQSGYIIELSEGRGIDNNQIYGVTIAKYNINKKAFVTQLEEFEGFNQCFNSYQEALIQVDNISKRIKDVLIEVVLNE